MAYIPNNEFLCELRLSQINPTETLCMYFSLMIQTEIFKFRFNYAHKEDLQQDLLLYLLTIYKKFNLDNPSPYNYFQKCIHRKMIQITVSDMKHEIDERMLRYSIEAQNDDWMSDDQIKYYNGVFMNKLRGRSGERNPMYGKKHSEETRKKISESMKRRNQSS